MRNAKVETYQLLASNGRPIRKATRVVRENGAIVEFTELMTKSEAIRQSEGRPGFKRGDLVVDRDGFEGSVCEVTAHNGAYWYDVRFARGCAVRFEYDLTRRASL